MSSFKRSLRHTLRRLTALGMLAVALPLAAAERAIDKQVDVAAGIDEVWKAWTTREGLVGFFAPEAVVEARVGGPFELHFDPGAPAGQRGADGMRIMALQPPRMLRFDWNAPPSLPQAREQRTFVVGRLTPVDAQTTRVSLHHTGWGDGGEWDRAYAYFDRAWGNVLGGLQKRFKDGPVNWQPWLAQLAAARARAATTAPGAGTAASAPR